MKHLKKFKILKESELNRESRSDLESLKSELMFISKFNVEIYQVADAIEKLLKMSWEEIEELRNSLLTNHSMTDLESLTVNIIDKYCSPIVEQFKLNESKSTSDLVVSMEVKTAEWDDDEDFVKTKTLVVKTKSGKIYTTKLKSDEDEDYIGEQ